MGRTAHLCNAEESRRAAGKRAPGAPFVPPLRIIPRPGMTTPIALTVIGIIGIALAWVSVGVALVALAVGLVAGAAARAGFGGARQAPRSESASGTAENAATAPYCGSPCAGLPGAPFPEPWAAPFQRRAYTCYVRPIHCCSRIAAASYFIPDGRRSPARGNVIGFRLGLLSLKPATTPIASGEATPDRAGDYRLAGRQGTNQCCNSW